MRRALLIAAVAAPIWATLCAPTQFAAQAAELDGVPIPPALQVDGTTLQLNGYGLRTYSIFAVHIYVVALYLEHLSTDASAILQSPDTKLLTVRFVHDVSAEAARDAWRKGFAKNCLPPCRIAAEDLAHFLAEVPAMRAGENFSILFNRQGATVTANGVHFGVIPNSEFARAILATFLGPEPASAALKAALLQAH
jgi:hypothetical protein